MIVRLGYVAMSTLVQNASPSKTMTYTRFSKLEDREAALRKLEQIAATNLHNTLRLLRHNRAYHIQLYRFSSRLIPLLGHEQLQDWHPIAQLKDHFVAIGDYVKEHNMRVSFHPDHFTVLSTPHPHVLQSSTADLERHVQMIETMGLDPTTKCNIHVGGTYGDKHEAQTRFIKQFSSLPERIRRHMTLENDDKTFTALETLTICEQVGVPLVLDIHHHAVNHTGESASELWPRIQQTWTQFAGDVNLPPKIHLSSPKNTKNIRSHADYIDPEPFFDFLRSIAPLTQALDVMIEAKMKDSALLQLLEDAKHVDDVTIIDQASFEMIC